MSRLYHTYFDFILFVNTGHTAFHFDVQSHSSGSHHPIRNCLNPYAILKSLNPQSLTL